MNKLTTPLLMTVLFGARAAWALPPAERPPPSCIKYLTPSARGAGSRDLPRLTASDEVNELVREYWKAADDLASASRPSSLYAGFYGATDPRKGHGEIFAGPLLAFRLSWLGTPGTVARDRAIQTKQRILNFGLPEAVRVIEERIDDLTTVIAHSQEQPSSTGEPAPDGSIEAGARLQYEREAREYADRQLKNQCQTLLNLFDARKVANEWTDKLQKEIEDDDRPRSIGWAFVPASLQFGLGYGFRAGNRSPDEPETLVTGHFGLMSSANGGAYGLGLVLGQRDYVGVYVSLGTDIGIAR